MRTCPFRLVQCIPDAPTHSLRICALQLLNGFSIGLKGSSAQRAEQLKSLEALPEVSHLNCLVNIFAAAAA